MSARKDDCDRLKKFIDLVAEASQKQTGGKWLEEATLQAAPLIRDWDIALCYTWKDWPDRKAHLPNSTDQDTGVDLVAVRRSDGKHIAIQCKSRKLGDLGSASDISKDELDSFMSRSEPEVFAERFVITLGDASLTREARTSFADLVRPPRLRNFALDLQRQYDAACSEPDEDCEHCESQSSSAPPPFQNSDSEAPRQTKSCMQREAIRDAVRILREHEQSDSGGLPEGQARGKIILPCGTGKTRISLRIVEELTPRGGLSIVLCPSIALVAQIRREYLQHAQRNLRALAVCSDETAGYDPGQEEKRSVAEDPTADISNVSASEIPGQVTTNAPEIADWIESEDGFNVVNVLFGTYQSGHRVAAALDQAGISVRVLVADEAHRTAGLPQSKRRTLAAKRAENSRLRSFALCHDQRAFPATYRVYQTATPRIYGPEKTRLADEKGWVVRSMDDEQVFGVDLFRKSYPEAVRNGWLADYRIIAIGVNNRAAYERANQLAQEAMAEESTGRGRKPINANDSLRGLAFVMAMGGTTQVARPDSKDGANNHRVEIKSCIAFMNTVAKSKRMAHVLQSEGVREWLQQWLNDNTKGGQVAVPYSLEHVDATSNVAERDNAKNNLAKAASGAAPPHGVLNVGIFGEGTDSPTLSAVAFLAPRRSPIDVIQAVGRAMRTAPDKQYGYIVVPILIPPNADPEEWLKSSTMSEWPELGQILLALRAHDDRIENEIESLLELYLPEPPGEVTTLIAIGDADLNVRHFTHTGPVGSAEADALKLVRGDEIPVGFIQELTAEDFERAAQEDGASVFETPPPVMEPTTDGETIYINDEPIAQEPSQIVTGKPNGDDFPEIRIDEIEKEKPKQGDTHGAVNVEKSVEQAEHMLNGQAGRVVQQEELERKATPRREEFGEQALQLLEWDENANAIRMNLLAHSGLTSDKVTRDLNLLREGVVEAAHQLNQDGLKPALDRHFELDNLKPSQKRADGATIAALLMMNAAMLHQRIAVQGWLDDVEDLESAKSAPDIIEELKWQWNRIIGQDFKTVLQPALNAIRAVERTGKRAGLERALRHLAAEAARIAETYADMGADHAGALFNRVMGDQSSEGAFFTRPVGASLLARLALDAAESSDADWKDQSTWRRNRAVDLACGSGTLLAALLTDMKRRAKERGASRHELAELHKLAVEDTLKGMDINDVSLQLAASRLTAGEQDIAFRRMGLHKMPYGPKGKGRAKVAAGTLELLGQSSIIGQGDKMQVGDDDVGSISVWQAGNRVTTPRNVDPELEDAVVAAKQARIVVMNPPFTNRAKMGEKFSVEVQRELRRRVDRLRLAVTQVHPEVAKFGDKNSIAPLFVKLAECCLDRDNGILAIVNPTIAMSNPSGEGYRAILAAEFHIHTVLTCHDPKQPNFSENTKFNESIIIATRKGRENQPTRFISLDRLPAKESEVDELFSQIDRTSGDGVIPGRWGQISRWPRERVSAGDWTPGIWRSRDVAEFGFRYATDHSMPTIREADLRAVRTDLGTSTGFEPASKAATGSFPALNLTGEDAQQRIQSTPDSYWLPQSSGGRFAGCAQSNDTKRRRILAKASPLLVASGHNAKTARLTAVADAIPYVGNGWLPVPGATVEVAKALAVFINSTAGRVQLMRTAGRLLVWPLYGPKGINNIRIPDPSDDRIMRTLADCWERTKDMLVPQFGEGECEVRQIWDDAVAEAMGWDAAELTRLRLLLHREPHVSGRRYGHYGD